MRRWIHFAALGATIAGLGFMAFVVVNTVSRYGLSWSFDPEHNEHIASFIAAVTGTLFGLTNAILLYAALTAQQQATAQSDRQHHDLAEERRYERLSAHVLELEKSVLAYKVTVSEPGKGGKTIQKELVGYPAWERAFDYWVSVSFKSSVRAALLLGEVLDPDAYLHDQAHVVDVLVRLNHVIQDVQRLRDTRDKNYLLSKAERMRNRLAKHKDRIRTARDFLRQTVDEGIPDYPKQQYVSIILHVINQIDDVLKMLPDVPHRILTPFGKLDVQLSTGHNPIFFESIDIPTIQIDKVTFRSKDKSWMHRLNGARLWIEMEANDTNGQQIHFERRPFALGILFTLDFKLPEFDTRGQWISEAQYNPHGQLEQHARWRVSIQADGLDFRDSEHLDLVLYTNVEVSTDERPLSVRL